MAMATPALPVTPTIITSSPATTVGIKTEILTTTITATRTAILTPTTTDMVSHHDEHHEGKEVSSPTSDNDSFVSGTPTDTEHFEESIRHEVTVITETPLDLDHLDGNFNFTTILPSLNVIVVTHATGEPITDPDGFGISSSLNAFSDFRTTTSDFDITEKLIHTTNIKYDEISTIPGTDPVTSEDSVFTQGITSWNDTPSFISTLSKMTMTTTSQTSEFISDFTNITVSTPSSEDASTFIISTSSHVECNVSRLTSSTLSPNLLDTDITFSQFPLTMQLVPEYTILSTNASLIAETKFWVRSVINGAMNDSWNEMEK